MGDHQRQQQHPLASPSSTPEEQPRESWVHFDSNHQSGSESLADAEKERTSVAAITAAVVAMPLPPPPASRPSSSHSNPEAGVAVAVIRPSSSVHVTHDPLTSGRSSPSSPVEAVSRLAVSGSSEAAGLPKQSRSSSRVANGDKRPESSPALDAVVPMQEMRTTTPEARAVMAAAANKSFSESLLILLSLAY